MFRLTAICARRAQAGSCEGGAGQRLLLARALYRQPAVLFLDEFTSHLDPACEARILEGLAPLPLTLVAVAHRQESVRRADREIALPTLAHRFS